MGVGVSKPVNSPIAVGALYSGGLRLDRTTGPVVKLTNGNTALVISPWPKEADESAHLAVGVSIPGDDDSFRWVSGELEVIRLIPAGERGSLGLATILNLEPALENKVKDGTIDESRGSARAALEVANGDILRLVAARRPEVYGQMALSEATERLPVDLGNAGATGSAARPALVRLPDSQTDDLNMLFGFSICKLLRRD
jgi:hypothetical protein